MTRALCLLLVSSAAWAGTTLTWERTRGKDAPTSLVTKCEGGNARFEGAAAGRVILWDAATKTLSMLDPAKKTYRQVTEAELQQMRELAKKRLEQLPPEQREKMEKAMGTSMGALGGEWKFTPTGKKAKIGKWDCEWFDGERGGLKTQTCMTPWPAAPVKKEELDCVRSLLSMTQTLARDDGGGDDFTRFPGIPIQTVRDDGDGTKNVSTLKAVDRGPLPPEAFAVPKDYTPAKRKLVAE